MARSFSGTAQYITIGNSVVTAFPFSLSCFVKLSAATTEQAIFAAPSSQTSANNWAFIDYRGDSLGSGGTKSIQFKINKSTSAVMIDTATNTTTGSWIFLGAIFTSSQILGWVNTTAYGPQSHVIPFPGGAHACIGGLFQGSSTPVLLLNGSVANAAAWSVQLTTAEMNALSNGALPFTIRAKSLVGFWPLDGLQSPEPDFSGLVKNGTLTGTALANGPPMTLFTPRRPSNALISAPTAAQIYSFDQVGAHITRKITSLGY